MSGHVRHLYVHVPFCAHRCGYCDFVTVVGRHGEHGRYVEALLRELELERDVLADEVETVFLGGGTPTFLEPRALERLLRALPAAAEVTVEANPETVTPELAELLRRSGVTRISLGAQSFDPRLLEVLERGASPDDVRRAFSTFREAGFDNVSLDLIYGIPGQSVADLERDLDEALALEPDHLSCYELEAKPGTRFTHAFGDELARQADAMEDYFERVVERLTGAGYRWYETANFCRPGARGTTARSTTSRTGTAATTSASASARSRRSRASAGGTARRSPATSRRSRVECAPPRETEQLDLETRQCRARSPRPAPRRAAAARGPRVGGGRRRALAPPRASRARSASATARSLSLTQRGRFLGGGVTAELLA